MILKGERYILFLKNPNSFWYPLLFFYFEITRAQKIVYLQRKGLIKQCAGPEIEANFMKTYVIIGLIINMQLFMAISLTTLSLSLSLHYHYHYRYHCRTLAYKA